MNQNAAAPSKAELSTTDRLFDSAAALFWRQGFAATTTREIAAALGIQQASLYHHMASKEDLLFRICLSSLTPFLDDVPGKVEAAAGPRERIRVFIGAHLATLLRYQQRNVTLLTELRSLSTRHRGAVVAIRDQYEKFSRGLLEKAQAARELRDDIAAKYLSLALMSMMNHAALWFRKEGERREGEIDEQQLAAILAAIFLEGTALPEARASVVLPDFAVEKKKPVARARKTAADNPGQARALNAAVALFSRKGYAATSTREVAELLGIQKASLYYHVESKEDMLFVICKSSLAQIRTDVETALGDPQSPLDRTRTLICAHVESLLRDEARHTATFGEMHSLSEQRLTEVLKLRHAYEEMVRGVLLEAQEAGVLRRDIDVKYLCLALLGLMNRVRVWYRRGGTLSPNQIGRLLAVLFLTGAGRDA